MQLTAVNPATKAGMKIGQLAKRTGLSVRTLHYYDQIGLLSPSHYTEVGYRLYTTGDIVRLQQIKSLRQLGLSLDEIRECLDRPDFSPQRVIELHIARLKQQIEFQRRLVDRLGAIAKGLRFTGEVSVEEFIQIIEGIKKMESRFTPEQLEYIKKRGEIVGDEQIRQVEAEWPALIEEVRVELDKGTDPSDPRAQELARRWMGLVQEFTGGDRGIGQAVNQNYQEDLTAGGRLDPRMLEYMDYISKATAASKGGNP